MNEIVVLLATYNGQEFLKEQLDSLLAQSFQNFKIVIHDDGSCDDTPSIIADYKKEHPDRILVLQGKATGCAKNNFLWMLKEVEADYYFLCDQDDVWHKDKIKKSLEAIESMDADGPACVFTDMFVTDDSLQVLSDSFVAYIGRSMANTAFGQILIDNPAAGCTMCLNKSLRDLTLQTMECIDISNIPMHDAFILEIASLAGQIFPIREPLVFYRQTGHNAMGATTETDADKTNRNISDIKSGTIFQKKKAFVKEARVFAGEMAKAPWLSVDKKDILIRFSKIESKSKFKRISFYRKHNFTRAGHNLWFMLWV